MTQTQPNATSGFVIQLVGTAEETEVFIVGIAANADGTGRSLLFSVQSHAEWYQHDIAAEEDTYAIVDEFQRTTYGGVTGCVLTRQELRLTFTPDAAAELRIDEHCRFPLRVDAAAVEQLRHGLRRVLTGGHNGRGTPAQLLL